MKEVVVADVRECEGKRENGRVLCFSWVDVVTSTAPIDASLLRLTHPVIVVVQSATVPDQHRPLH